MQGSENGSCETCRFWGENGGKYRLCTLVDANTAAESVCKNYQPRIYLERTEHSNGSDADSE